jgi:EmrB/QacA subfamily drug resistance transporter
MHATAAHSTPTTIAPRIQTNPWIVLLVLTLGSFMIMLDTSIVSIAIPSMERNLGANFDQILWVLNAYTLIYAVLLITAGRLGDMFGPKNLFITGLIIFTLASAACSFARTPGQLIIFRVIQAVGGAALMPQTLAVLPTIFPPERRGAAFGIWSAVIGLATVIGPTLGGLLVTRFSWQSVFYVNIPVGIAVIAAAVLLLPETRSGRRHHLDLPGVALVSTGLFLLIYALIEGQKYSWGPIKPFAHFSLGPTEWSLLSVYSLITYALLLLAAFVWYETRALEPLLPLSLFRDRNFSVTNLVGGAAGFAMIGISIPLTIFLQSVLGFSAIHAGLTQVPLALALLFAAPLVGRLTDLINGKYVVMAGMAASALGVGLTTWTLALSNEWWSFTIPLAITGLGLAFIFVPLNTLAMRDVPPALAGAASGAVITIRQVAMALGAAVIGSILTNRTAGQMPKQTAEAARHLAPALRDHLVSTMRAASHGSPNFGSGQAGSPKLPAGTSPAIAHQVPAILHQAFAHSYLSATRVALPVVVIALVAGALASGLMRGGRTAEAARKVQQPAVEVEALAS